MKKKGSNANVLSYEGYVGSIEFSLSDNYLHGKVQGLSKILISYKGRTLDDLRADFKKSIDEYLIDCQKTGADPQKPFKGALNVRLSPGLHKQAALVASKNGISLNALIRKAVEQEVKSFDEI
jgi:predicted HicB family RNase H-like nuclease